MSGAHGDVARGDETIRLYQRSLESAEGVAAMVDERLQSGVSEEELTSRLYEQHMKDGLGLYPKEMMMAVINLIKKKIQIQAVVVSAWPKSPIKPGVRR